MNKKASLFEIKTLLQAEVFHADLAQCVEQVLQSVSLTGVEALENAQAHDISFYYGLEKSRQVFINTRSKVCVLSKEFINLKGVNALMAHRQDLYLLAVKDIHLAFAKVMRLFYLRDATDVDGVSPYAFVSKSAKLGNGCCIYPYAFIGEDVVIGDNCTVYHSATIMNAVLGNDVIVHSGARIGKDGFKYATDATGRHISVPHKGKVIIGNAAEIGANCCIDRGALADTVIGDMCKLDNLVQIGHNVVLGKGCLVVSQVGIAGSSTLGQYVALGGQAGVADHIIIGDHVKVAAQSGVMNDLSPGSVVMGFPAQPIREFFKQVAALKKLFRKQSHD